LLVRQIARFGKNRQRISAKCARRKNVELIKLVFLHSIIMRQDFGFVKTAARRIFIFKFRSNINF